MTEAYKIKMKTVLAYLVFLCPFAVVWSTKNEKATFTFDPDIMRNVVSTYLFFSNYLETGD